MSPGRKISVIGLGYVGLPVAVAFAKHQRVIGCDIDPVRITELESGIDNTGEVEADDLKQADILFTDKPDDLRSADFHIVAVPTPINKAKQPDLYPVLSASRLIGSKLKKGDIIVYESTVYPGATEEDCIPVLEQESGLRAGRDFHVGYSPERINPGDKEHTFTRIKKVISAQNEETLTVIASVYGSVVTAGVHKTATIKIAEAAKVIENTQRDLNIALMNELALIFNKMQIDTYDVLEAAGTKWNFLPFKPGLVGGHCIGVDPYYLTHKAAMLGYEPQVILAGRSINDGMGEFVASRVVKTLILEGHNVKQSTVSILGFTFKENVPDLRNTHVIDIVRELQSYGVNTQVHDPRALTEEAESEYGIELLASGEMQPAEAVVLAVPHDEYIDMGWAGVLRFLKNDAGIVFDIKSVLSRKDRPDSITLCRL